MNFKILSFILIFFLVYFNSQVLPQYPRGQDFYEGGSYGLLVDMIKVTRENKIKKCANNDEIYYPSVLVYPDATINFVKDFDSINIQKNKCAYDFAIKILPKLKKWNPAIVDSVKMKAIAKFPVAPFVLYHSKLNPKENVFTPPIYSNGHDELLKKVSIVLTKDVLSNTTDYSLIAFVINEKGKIINTYLTSDGISRFYSEKLSIQLSNLSGDWAPATFNSAPTTWFYLVALKPSKKIFRNYNNDFLFRSKFGY
ncbi:hypothetical protein [Chryseobacterium sp. YIM B08800]|uniref:hypothetical protein n=1 Tax=Chryseobacterium sp. YIM B08800 TaxID=2984136 RepID=UPI00223FA2E1|nr:hypothetical protein [Chryseobacterium sp. YIM B08800]